METIKINNKLYCEMIRADAGVKRKPNPYAPYYAFNQKVIQVDDALTPGVKLYGVDILSEFIQIQERTSELSKKQRDEVERLFSRYFIEIKEE